MTYLFHKRQTSIFIYIVLVILLLNYFTIDNLYTTNNNIDDTTLPYFFAMQYQLEILNLQELHRNKISLNMLYGIVNLFVLILACIYNLILDYRYGTYLCLHISRLFIILQRLLLPRQNSSRYKAPLLLSIQFN